VKNSIDGTPLLFEKMLMCMSITDRGRMARNAILQASWNKACPSSLSHFLYLRKSLSFLHVRYR
jgi:hypothetical protein